MATGIERPVARGVPWAVARGIDTPEGRVGSPIPSGAILDHLGQPILDNPNNEAITEN